MHYINIYIYTFSCDVPYNACKKPYDLITTALYQGAAKAQNKTTQEKQVKHWNCLPKDNINDDTDLYCAAGTRVILCWLK